MLTVLSGAAAAGVTPAEPGAFIPNISGLWHAERFPGNAFPSSCGEGAAQCERAG